MPSTRRQKAKERRSRQLDKMSDVENVDIMLGSYSRDDEENNMSENEMNLGSGSSTPQQSSNVIGEDFRSLLNTNSRENSEITIETTRLINEEISNQVTRKLNEIKTSLNSQIQDAITVAITRTVLPSIQNTLETQVRSNFTVVDRGSNGPHPSPMPTDSTIKDRRSSGLHRNPEVGNSQKTWENRPRTCFAQENSRLRSRESSTVSMNSEQNRDMVTGANPTPHMVPEFLTGRPMQSGDPLQRQNSNNNESQVTIPQVPETTGPTTPSDPINRLAEVLVGMNNRPSAQTLMVRPVSTTTLTFDGKSEKFELFEDLFHTMIKMQPDMTETMKINHFHSLLRKNALQTFRNINTANRQTLEDILAVFRRKYVKPESQATAKHKWHRLVFDPNTMKLPDFLEELNQGAEKAFGENAQAMIDSLLYAKLPPKLKRSVNMARLENATYEENVTHLERELELNGLEEGMTSQYQQCPLPLQQHDRELAFFPLALIQTLLGTIARNPDMSKTIAANSNERRNNAAMKGRIPRKSIPNVQLATKQTIRRNDVGKALEPTSSPKTSNWRTLQPQIRPPVKKTQTTSKQPQS